MARGIRLIKVLGIQVSIDYTWFIVFVFFAWSLAVGYFPHYYPGLGRGTYIGMGVVSSLLLFLCVLIHELSHSYTANRLGLSVREITLFIFGGIASLDKDPESAGTELKVALAGPLASAVLAGAFYLASEAMEASLQVAPAIAIARYLSFVNLMLFAFNMIPGFPLDGGRVLRAAWWARSGNKDRATIVGRGFAYFLIITGVLQVFTGAVISGLWSVFIGVFLQQAAQGEYQHLVLRRSLEGFRVRDIMSRAVVSIDGGISIKDAVEDYFLKHHFASFPVISGGKVTGIITLRDVRAIERPQREGRIVGDAMQRLSNDDMLGPDMPAFEALARITRSSSGRLPVLDKEALVGMVSRRDIMRIIELKTGLHNE
jgi:Zn-dependent protease/predicted transcriptional regulator